MICFQGDSYCWRRQFQFVLTIGCKTIIFIQRSSEAAKKETDFDKIFKNKMSTYFIHYACEALDDSNSGLSPRVTAVAILHYGSGKTKSFGVHLSAEELHIGKDEISNRYEEIEKDILTGLAAFMKERIHNTYWVHWNMNDETYGFEAPNHRYKVLTGGTMPCPMDTNMFNLSSMLAEKYGKGYAKDPKMACMVDINGGKQAYRHFLTGREEVTEYKAGEYVRLLASTKDKVRFFRNVCNAAVTNKLVTQNNKFWSRILHFLKRGNDAASVAANAITIASAIPK